MTSIRLGNKVVFERKNLQVLIVYSYKPKVCMMWWLICSAPDFWGRSLGFKSGTAGPLCNSVEISGKRGEPPPETKNKQTYNTHSLQKSLCLFAMRDC